MTYLERPSHRRARAKCHQSKLPALRAVIKLAASGNATNQELKWAAEPQNFLLRQRKVRESTFFIFSLKVEDC